MFWAPWCKVCRRELVEIFVKEQAGSFALPTAYDEDRWVSQSFKINATPTSVLLDEQGRIALVHRGSGILQNAQFREFLSRRTR